jgi:hypothetical protein
LIDFYQKVLIVQAEAANLNQAFVPSVVALVAVDFVPDSIGHNFDSLGIVLAAVDNDLAVDNDTHSLVDKEDVVPEEIGPVLAADIAVEHLELEQVDHKIADCEAAEDLLEGKDIAVADTELEEHRCIAEVDSQDLVVERTFVVEALPLHLHLKMAALMEVVEKPV